MKKASPGGDLDKHNTTPEPPDDGPQGPDPQVTEAIGKQLRTIYDAFAKEPVPDHLMELMAKLGKEPKTE